MRDKKLNLGNNINQYLSVVLEYFVKFYGEEYRDIIKNRFSNCTCIGYTPFNVVRNYLDCVYNEKIKELIDCFFKENQLEVSNEFVLKYFEKDSRGFFKELSGCKLSKLFEYIYNGIDNIYIRNSLLQLLKSISGNKNITFGSKEFYDVVNKLKLLKPSFDKMIKDFENFKLNYSEYEEYLDYCDKVYQKIRNKYLLSYLKEIYEYLSKHDRELVDRAESGDFVISPNMLNCSGVLCGNFYSDTTLVDSFSSESEEKLNDVNEKKYIRNSIINDRINFFNKLGISLGNNYKEYMNDDRVIQLRSNVDKILDFKKSLSKKERQEFISLIIHDRNQLDGIENLDIVSQCISYNYDGVDSNIAFVTPNVIEKEGKKYLHNLLLFSSGYDGRFDTSFIHEVNHIAEIKLDSYKDDSFTVISGWDILYFDDNTLEDDKKREFEYFNEIINELIAQDITKMLHDDGVYLFDDKKNAKILGNTNYEMCRCLVESFYIEFKEEIKRSRCTGNIDSLSEVIGYNNFLKLNQLVNEYMEYFDYSRYHKMVDDYEAGYDTCDTLYYDECIEEAEMILQDMINESYKKSGTYSM